LGFFESEKEMVAGSDHYNAFITGGAYILYAGQRGCAVYLYALLILYDEESLF